MLVSKFTEKKTGQIVAVHGAGDVKHAFVPNELSPNWSIPIELWPLIAEAREAIGTLNGIGLTKMKLAPFLSLIIVTSQVFRDKVRRCTNKQC